MYLSVNIWQNLNNVLTRWKLFNFNFNCR